MRRGRRPKTKFLDVNYLIGTIQCLALSTIDLHPKDAFLVDKKETFMTLKDTHEQENG